MIVYEYDLDMVPGLTQGRTVVSLSQYDDNFFINFHLYTRNGSFVIESGTTARIRGTKPDGNGFSATATVDASDMTVLVEGDKQMTAAAGTSQYELTLMKGTKELNTANFDVYIERAALDIDTPSSETKLRELYDLPVDEILQAATTAVDAKDDAEDARDAAIAAKDEAVSVTDGLEELVKGNFIYETASGSMASFSDGGDSLPVKSVSVNVDPVQDLHGYSKPWTGGAGKNLIDYSNLNSTSVGIAYTYNQYTGEIKTTWSASNGAHQLVLSVPDSGSLAGKTVTLHYDTVVPSSSRCNDWRIFLLSYVNGGSEIIIATFNVSTASSITLTINSNVTELRLLLRLSQSISAQSGDYVTWNKIQLEIGSSATSYEPYSNICPITGHTSAAITRVGKNLLPLTVDGIKAINTRGTWTGNSYVLYGMTFTLNTDSAGNITSIDVSGTNTAPGVTYPYLDLATISSIPYGSYIINGGTTNIKVRAYRYDGTNSAYSNGADVSFTSTSDASINTFDIYVDERMPVSGTVYPMIRLASDTDPTFEPYHGHVYNIAFPGAAGTVYGGTLDLNAGRLTVDKAYIASYSGQSINAPWISSMDEYAARRTPTTGAQVVYPLTTPVTYNFTAEEITTLLGISHIWADTGDVSVEYAADPKLYINKVIANALNA